MNQNLGLIGKKLGNTQIFNDDGTVSRVTAIQAGPCTVLAKRTTEKHGYTALQLGFGQRDVNKPIAGYFAKLGKEPAEVVTEIRVPEEELAKYEVGQELKASDVFEVGQRVDVSGRTKGRGFTG